METTTYTKTRVSAFDRGRAAVICQSIVDLSQQLKALGEEKGMFDVMRALDGLQARYKLPDFDWS